MNKDYIWMKILMVLFFLAAVMGFFWIVFIIADFGLEFGEGVFAVFSVAVLVLSLCTSVYAVIQLGIYEINENGRILQLEEEVKRLNAIISKSAGGEDTKKEQHRNT